MNHSLVKLISDAEKTKGEHILYLYENIERYLENAISFIMTGVKKGSHILLVENDRNMRSITKQLETQLSKEQLTKVHFVNNFDFYYSNGDFHPQTILRYVSKNIAHLVEEGVPVFTWGLIEWREDKEIAHKVEEYEKGLDKLVNEKKLVSACAYDASRTPLSLKEALMRCHGVMMLDDEVIYLSENKPL